MIMRKIKMISNEKALYCFAKTVGLTKEESREALKALRFLGSGVCEDTWFEEVGSKMKAWFDLACGINIFTKDGLRIQDKYSHNWYDYRINK
jgi:hypothetical protein